MPHESIQYLPKKHLMTFEEMERLLSIMAGLGITKVRFTGGEPFLRNDLMSLIRRTSEIPGIADIRITTNGILTAPFIPLLKQAGVSSVNLSLDTLDPQRFFQITQRDEFRKTMESLELLQNHEIPLKINAVVMEGKNIDDIVPLAEMTRDKPIDVRFIEEMPFNGRGDTQPTKLKWNHRRIRQHLEEHFGALLPQPAPAASTSENYRIAGHMGTIGIIAAFSRTFCGTCNRIRVTPQGVLKTCLYDQGALNLRDMMRAGDSDEQIRQSLVQAFSQRAKDGFEAEQRKSGTRFESMSTIGG